MNIFRGSDRVRVIENVSKLEVNYFQNQRWQLVTFMEKLLGIWPYQRKYKQYPLQLFYFLALLSVFLAIGNRMQEYKRVNDIDMVIECIIYLLLVFALMVKLILSSIFRNYRQKVYERIVEHFKVITDRKEAAVINEIADQGFNYTAIYMCFICISVGLFFSVSILAEIYQYCFTDGQLELTLPLPVDYGFDSNKYWYLVALFLITYACSAVVVNFTHDMSFILQIRHVQALFKIIRMRLSKASELDDALEEGVIVSDESADESYSIISSAIDLHADCLEMINKIEDTYTINWFVVLLSSTIGFGGGLYTISTKLHDPTEMFRYCCLYVLVLAHFQIIFSQGQQIINSSSEIADACYDYKWYGAPKKSRKLIIIMMMRTSIRCRLTGAKLFPLSMESFSKLLKAGLSYYAVFKS